MWTRFYYFITIHPWEQYRFRWELVRDSRWITDQDGINKERSYAGETEVTLFPELIKIPIKVIKFI